MNEAEYWVVVVLRRGGVLRTLHVGRAARPGRSGQAGGAGAFRLWRHAHPERPTFTSSVRPHRTRTVLRLSTVSAIIAATIYLFTLGT